MIHALSGNNYSNINLIANLYTVVVNSIVVPAPSKTYQAAGSGIVQNFETETGILQSSFAQDEFAVVTLFNITFPILFTAAAAQYNIIGGEGQVTGGLNVKKILVSREAWGSSNVRCNFPNTMSFYIATYRIRQFAL